MSGNLKSELQQVYQKINTNEISETKLNTLRENLATELNQQLSTLPSGIATQWKQLQAESKEIVDVKGKFKWEIAIIPGILKYETEASKTIPIFKWARAYWSNFNLKTETK